MAGITLSGLLSVVSCSRVSLCVFPLWSVLEYIKTLTIFPVSLIAVLFLAAGLAAWEEYPSLKMLMEMVMTK